MTLRIAAFYFFYFAIIGVYVIFMPKVLEMVGYAPSQIGILFASAPLVRFLVPFAFLRGLKLSRGVFYGALVIMSSCSLAYYPALEHFWPLLLVNVGFGIGLSLILPYVEVIALEHIGKERYGRVRLFGSIGFILVALALAELLETPGVAVAFLAATTVTTALFGYIIARAEPTHPAPACSSAHPFSLRRHLPLWIAFLLMQVSFGPFYNFFTIYATAHGVALDVTIYLWSFGVVSEIVLFYFQGPLMRRHLPTLLEFAMALTVVRWGIVWLFPETLWLLFAAQSLHAASFALFHTAAISHLYALYADKKLAQQFFLGISYGFGGFLGAVASGYIYEFRPDALFLSAASAALLGLVALQMRRLTPL